MTFSWWPSWPKFYEGPDPHAITKSTLIFSKHWHIWYQIYNALTQCPLSPTYNWLLHLRKTKLHSSFFAFWFNLSKAQLEIHDVVYCLIIAKSSRGKKKVRGVQGHRFLSWRSRSVLKNHILHYTAARLLYRSSHPAIGPIIENMTSSTKPPEIHNVLVLPEEDKLWLETTCKENYQ